jgi:predicted  nucleic acid-binding Zn-ribbon protein
MASVKEQIDILVQLQKLDARIYDLHRELEQKPPEIESLRQILQGKENAVKAGEEKLKSQKVKLKEMELDLKVKEENVKKLQIQLYQVKTNKEYSLMQKEIEGLKADNSLLEEGIIKFLDSIGSLEQEIVKEKESLHADKIKTDGEVHEIEQRVDSLKEELKSIETQRAEVARGVEKNLLLRYERVLVNKNGRALAGVLNDSCGGCNMALPPQVINEIRLSEKIITCENCQRILYIGV